MTQELTAADWLLPGVPRIESPFFAEVFAELDAPPEVLRVVHELSECGYAPTHSIPVAGMITYRRLRNAATGHLVSNRHVDGLLNGGLIRASPLRAHGGASRNVWHRQRNPMQERVTRSMSRPPFPHARGVFRDAAA